MYPGIDSVDDRMSWMMIVAMIGIIPIAAAVYLLYMVQKQKEKEKESFFRAMAMGWKAFLCAINSETPSAFPHRRDAAWAAVFALRL